MSLQNEDLQDAKPGMKDCGFRCCLDLKRFVIGQFGCLTFSEPTCDHGCDPNPYHGQVNYHHC
jgi:hypothetical protein